MSSESYWEKEIYKGYILGSDGTVFSKKTNRYLKQTVNRHGYLVFKTWQNGRTRNHQLHRELAKTFLANPENLPCVNHKDGDKLNNHISNLEWCSYSHNNSHAYETGLKPTKSTSGHKYITFDRYTGKWRISINLGNGIVIKGGRFETIKKALKQRNNLLENHAR